MTPCSHEGFHSGQGRYTPETGLLRYVVVCDACQQEMREVHVVEYRPRFEPYDGRQAKAA
jgi:hypothetical protein